MNMQMSMQELLPAESDEKVVSDVNRAGVLHVLGLSEIF